MAGLPNVQQLTAVCLGQGVDDSARVQFPDGRDAHGAVPPF